MSVVQDVRVARAIAEWRAAGRLVYEQYVRSGYMRKNSHGTRFTEADLRPSTQKFICGNVRYLKGTLAFQTDSESHGLPIDTVYAAEMADMRQSEGQIAELSAFAIRPTVGTGREWRSVQMALFAIMYHFALRQRVSDLVIAVHPRHASFYQRRLGFVEFGPDRPHPLVQGHRAVGLHHDIGYCQAHHDRFPGGLATTILCDFQFSKEVLCPAQLSKQQRERAFGSAVTGEMEIVPL